MADDDAPTGKPAKRAARAAAPKKTAPVKKAAIRKVIPAPPAPARKEAGSRVAARKAVPPAESAIAMPPAGDEPAKKAGGRKAVTRSTGASLASGPETPPTKPPRRVGSRLAAEQTFDDDWEPAPPPPSPGTDPAARARALLRSAAADLQAREAPSGRLTGYESKPDEPVTEVFVAPTERVFGRRSVPAPAPVVEPEARRDVEPEPEAEWTIEEQEIEEETVDRIPDAMDVLSLPDTTTSPPRRGSSPPPPPPPPPEPTVVAPAETPPAWTPPASPAKPERSGGRRRKRGVVLLVVLLVVGLAAAAVALVASRDQGVDYSKLKVGDCFDSSATNEVRGIDVKPCSEEHNSEVFFLVTHPAGPDEPYPGKDALVQFAADACLGQPLTDYLGIPLEQSQFKDFEIVPQESAWEDGRRVLVCGIDTGGGAKITGSVKGTAR